MGHSQDFMEANSSLLIDPTFECYSTSVSANVCQDIQDVSCAGMGSVSNDPLEICGHENSTSDLGAVYVTASSYTDAFGNITMPEIAFKASSSSSFNYTFLCSYSLLSVPEEATFDGSLFMVIRLGNREFRRLISPNDMAWTNLQYDFCTDEFENSLPISISFELPNIEEGQTIRVGIDGISLLKKMGCQACHCSSFAPVNKRYAISGWVKEGEQYYGFNYTSTIHVSIQGATGPPTTETFEPSGEVIDGWQRILGVFETPEDPQNFSITLENMASQVPAFFDDIRVYPLDSSMKSFVYDQDSKKLMAELDENNYATFYEYDAEGGLVRVKKETERGVFTIQESRSSTLKKQ